MFPGVDGFHWTFGHILFVTIFFAVLTVVGGTVLLAIKRSTNKLGGGAVEQLRWHSDFEHLSEEERKCRHELSGVTEYRRCNNRFECGECKDHGRFAVAHTAAREDVRGLHYPAGRLYHRGHTWVERHHDGTVSIGLDDFAAHVVGKPDRVELPAAGSKLETCATGWRMWKSGFDVRVLSPVAGEVVETGGPERGWYLRVRPDSNDFPHLLRGAEVEGWIERELERFQEAFVPQSQPTLADGGVLVHDVMANAPNAAWDEILGRVFLEP